MHRKIIVKCPQLRTRIRASVEAKNVRTHEEAVHAVRLAVHETEAVELEQLRHCQQARSAVSGAIPLGVRVVSHCPGFQRRDVRINLCDDDAWPIRCCARARALEQRLEHPVIVAIDVNGKQVKVMRHTWTQNRGRDAPAQGRV